jgi:hypothetical protein
MLLPEKAGAAAVPVQAVPGLAATTFPWEVDTAAAAAAAAARTAAARTATWLAVILLA